MTAFAVLHVTSMPGGGVNRCIGDIAAAGSRRHLVWHTAASADVIEARAPARFLPIDRTALEDDPAPLAQWLRAQGVGLVHVHSMSAVSRARAAWVAEALGVRAVATLHDVLFLRPDGLEPGASREPDPDWLRATSAFLERMAACVAPSEYIASLARRHVPRVHVDVVPNGSPGFARAQGVRARPEFLARKPGRVVAMLGAIGPHKGARLVERIAELLQGSDIAIVILGYLDAQLLPGWHGDHLFIHGAWEDAHTAALLEAYGAELVLFPNQAPESFSYALSDAWAAGMPVLVPSEGALGERVARHGGGWLLPAGFDAETVVAALRRLLAPDAAGERARVKSSLSGNDPLRVPPLDAMNRSLDALYARFGIDPAGPVDPLSAPAQRLIAANLDGAIFRPELARTADELAQLRAGLDAERDHAARFERESRAWIAKLEGDIATLQRELRAEVEERRRLQDENRELRARRSLAQRIANRLRRIVRGARKGPDAR